MGKPLVRFCEGQGYNRDRDEILWHRRESRRQTEKTNLVLSHGSPLPTRKDGLATVRQVHPELINSEEILDRIEKVTRNTLVTLHASAKQSVDGSRTSSRTLSTTQP